MARTRTKPASPPVPGDAGTEVTDEPVQVISRAASVDVAKGSGMVCLRLPHESRAGRRTQKVWEVTANFAAIVTLMDYLVCQGTERLVLESTSWENSMPGNRRPRPGVRDGASGDPRDIGESWIA